jgi:PAS domain S-box-containing protein
MKYGTLDPDKLQNLIYRALDGSDDLIVVLERAGDGADGLIVVATNDAFLRASGHTTSGLIGRPFHALAAPDADLSNWKAAAQSANDRRSFRSELLCVRPNGTSFWLGLHIMPIAETSPVYTWCLVAT